MMLNNGFILATAADAAPADGNRLIIAAILGLLLLLLLIIKVKLQPILSILVSAIFIGVVAGMSFDAIVGSIGTGIGNTLKGIALLVGLGSMFGAILEISGGAQRIAVTLVDRFGERKSAWALGITGLIIAMPVFFDAGLIILIPLAFSLAKRTKKSTLIYAIPLLAGLAVGHAFIPPTPGPILVANLLGVELGYVIFVGLIAGTISMIIAGPLFGRFIGTKIHTALPHNVEEMPEYETDKLPGFATVVSIILIPLVLILLNTASKAIPALAPAKPFLGFIGEPFVALTIATLFAMYALGTRHGYTRDELGKIMTKSLEPTGMILLVTACGGVLRYTLADSGLGEIIGHAVSTSALPLVVVAFIVAALVRISVGSATVAMTMAAGIMAAMPEITGYSPLYLACVTAAIAGGATVVSHFNDSGFWLVKSLLDIDEKTTLKSWTVMETIVGFSGFAVALVISTFA